MVKHRVSPASRIMPESASLSPKDVTKDEAVRLISNMFYGAGIDVDEKLIKRQKKNDLLGMFNNMASLVSRSALQSALGQSFGGKRDLYEVLGWTKQLQFNDFLMMYERNGIAARVVDIKADESWREYFVLHDGKGKEDYQDDTPFLNDWINLSETLDMQAKFHELDLALGISRFAIMVFGVQGEEGNDYGKPLDESKEGRTISWVRVLDEGQVTMSQPISDPFNPRYGLPDLYGCQFEQGGQSVSVHHSRVIHFKRGRGRSNTYGVPSLQKSFNYLQDLEKVVGSSSEAFWQHIRRAIALTAREGFTLPEKGTPAYTNLQQEVEDFEHQMSLVLKLRNMDVTDLASSAVDGGAQGELLFNVIAGTEGIPQRILMGSERGELASSQDILNMNNSTASRQKKECTPWVKQTIKYLYMNKFIAPPTTGKFSVEWNPLYTPTPMEKIEIAKAEVEFLNTLTDGNIQEAITIEDMMDRAGFDGYRKGTTETKTPKNAGVSTTPHEDNGEGEDVEDTAGLEDQNPNSQRL